MKKTYYLLTVLFSVVIGCSDDEGEGIPGINGDVAAIKMFDIGNDVNGSDLLVNLEMNAVSNGEIRVMMMRRDEPIELTRSFLEDLPADQFVSETLTSELVYSVRLANNLSDLSGDPIQEGVSYVAQVYFPELNQLSEPSLALELKEAGSLDGVYDGNLSYFLVPGVQATIAGEGNLFEGDIEAQDFTVFFPGVIGTTVAEMSFRLEGDKVENFQLTLGSDLLGIIKDNFGCTDPPKVFKGSGEVVNFSEIRIKYTPIPCTTLNANGQGFIVNDDPGTLTLKRQ